MELGRIQQSKDLFRSFLRPDGRMPQGHFQGARTVSDWKASRQAELSHFFSVQLHRTTERNHWNPLTVCTFAYAGYYFPR